MSRAARLADRFKPTVFERLKQSNEAKALPRKKEKQEKTYTSAPKVVAATPQRSIFPVPAGMFTQTTGSFVVDPAQLWRTWNGGTVSSLTSNTHITDVWQAWAGSTITYTGATTTWGQWQDTDPFAGRGPRRLVETREQRAQRDIDEAHYRAERAAANARYDEELRASENRRKEADDRAMKLLVSMLNDQQKADLKRDKHFFVDAPSGRLYRIDYGTHGNVKVVDRVTRKVIERLCIQPNGVPAGDANLMQKLLIETAEETFRAHANITLEDGRVVYGKTILLDNVELAKVIPIRRAA